MCGVARSPNRTGANSQSCKRSFFLFLLKSKTFHLPSSIFWWKELQNYRQNTIIFLVKQTTVQWLLKTYLDLGRIQKTLIKRFLEDNFISYIMLSLEDLRNFKHQLMGHMKRSSYLIPLQEICGYQLSCVKMVGTFFLVLITFGLTLVLITWRKDIKVGQRDRQIDLKSLEL